MPNMGYVRFQNTYQDLRDCRDHLDDEDLSEEEKHARQSLINLCEVIALDYGDVEERDL
jgi:hypothetical protein